MPWNSLAVIATIVIVEGDQGGVFIYDSAGNLVDSMAFLASVDPETNSNLAGITNYAPGVSFAQIVNAGLFMGSLEGATRVRAPGAIQFQETLSDAAQPAIEIISPRTQATPATGTVQLSVLGESKDTTAPAQVLVSPQTATPSPNTGAILEVQGSMAIGASGAKFREWYAPTGTSADSTAINTALGNGYDVDITPGTVGVAATLALGGGQELRGSPGAILTPLGALAGGICSVSGNNNRIKGLQFASGGFSADAIQVAAGASRWYVEDIIANAVKGLIVNIPGSTGAGHGVISKVLGTGCNGGIAAVFGSGSSTAEISIAQCNIQSCQSAPVLVVNGVTDVGVDDLNGSVITGSGVPAVQLIGNAQSIFMNKVDVGGDKTAGGTTAVLDIGSSGGISEVAISDSVFQDGGNGIVVAGSASKIRFSSVMSKRNQFDNWQWSGTGAFNQMMGCAENLGNQAAGTGYGINVTSTAHVAIIAPAYMSNTAVVTASINITQAANHVTEQFNSSGRTSAGNVPAGW